VTAAVAVVLALIAGVFTATVAVFVGVTSLVGVFAGPLLLLVLFVRLAPTVEVAAAAGRLLRRERC